MKSRSILRFALILRDGRLAEDRNVSGPQTFSEASQAEAEGRYRESIGLEAGKPIKIKITWSK